VTPGSDAYVTRDICAAYHAGVDARLDRIDQGVTELWHKIDARDEHYAVLREEIATLRGRVNLLIGLLFAAVLIGALAWMSSLT